MASAPRPGASARAEAADAHVTFELDSKTYTVRPNEVPASLAGEFRRNVGMSFRQCLTLIASDPDLDILRALIWLARRQAGETLTLDDIADFTYDDAQSLMFHEDAAEDGDSPEA